MSTFDPGFEPHEPPGDWQRQAYYAPRPNGNEVGARAAVYVWVCAGVQFLMSSCCICAGLGMSVLPEEKLLEAVPPDTPNRQEFIEALPILGPAMLIIGVVILVIPAIIHAILAFYVRKGNKGATIASLSILGMQSLLFGLLILMHLAGAVINQSPGDLLLILLELVVFVLFIVALIALFKVLLGREQTPRHPSERGW